MTDRELCQWLRKNACGFRSRNTVLAAVRIEELLNELDYHRSKFKTHDGVVVKPGDSVWVLGSMGESHKTQVVGLATGYTCFSSPIMVSDSFSTEEELIKYRGYR